MIITIAEPNQRYIVGAVGGATSEAKDVQRMVCCLPPLVLELR